MGDKKESFPWNALDYPEDAARLRFVWRTPHFATDMRQMPGRGVTIKAHKKRPPPGAATERDKP
jgi:hypothetical protein